MHIGGTGKSEVIKATDRVLNFLGHRAGICAPTGVAATQLPNAKTFHSCFGAFYKEINSGNTLRNMKEALGGDDLKVIFIDEVSMLSTKFLVLADKRLRSMYNHTESFGGISVCLSGGKTLIRVVHQYICSHRHISLPRTST
jgi:hypothetical protein